MESLSRAAVDVLTGSIVMWLLAAVVVLIMSIFMWLLSVDSHRRRALKPGSDVTTAEPVHTTKVAEAPGTRSAQTEATASCSRVGHEINVIAQVDLVDAPSAVARRVLLDIWCGVTTSQKMRDIYRSTILGPGEIRLESRNKVGPIYINSALHLSTTVTDDGSSLAVHYRLLEPSFPIRILEQTSWIDETAPGLLTIHSEQRYEIEKGWAGSIPGIQYIVGKVCGYKLKRAVEDMRDTVLDEIVRDGAPLQDEKTPPAAINHLPIGRVDEASGTAASLAHRRRSDPLGDPPAEENVVAGRKKHSVKDKNGQRATSTKRKGRKHCALS